MHMNCMIIIYVIADSVCVFWVGNGGDRSHRLRGLLLMDQTEYLWGNHRRKNSICSYEPRCWSRSSCMFSLHHELYCTSSSIHTIILYPWFSSVLYSNVNLYAKDEKTRLNDASMQVNRMSWNEQCELKRTRSIDKRGRSSVSVLREIVMATSKR